MFPDEEFCALAISVVLYLFQKMWFCKLDLGRGQQGREANHKLYPSEIVDREA